MTTPFFSLLSNLHIPIFSPHAFTTQTLDFPKTDLINAWSKMAPSGPESRRSELLKLVTNYTRSKFAQTLPSITRKSTISPLHFLRNLLNSRILGPKSTHRNLIFHTLPKRQSKIQTSTFTLYMLQAFRHSNQEVGNFRR